MTVAAAVAICAALPSCSSGDPDKNAETVELTFAGFLAPGSPWRNTYEWWMGEVERRTDGAIKFKSYDQGSLLAQDAIMPGIKQGRADIGFFIEAFHPAELPLSTIAGVPFLTNDSEAQTRTQYELYNNYEPFHSEFDAQNIEIMYFPPATPNTFQSTKAINNLQDLEGMPIRALGMMSQALTQVKANPVAIPLPEVYESLNRGLIEANLTGFELVTDLKLQEVTRYVSDPGTGLYAMAMIGMNQKTWNDISEERQEILKEISEEAMLRNVEEFKASAEKVCTTLEAAGVSMTDWAETDTDSWKDQVFDGLRAQWIETASKSGAPAEEFFDKYVAALDKYEAESTYEPGVTACVS